MKKSNVSPAPVGWLSGLESIASYGGISKRTVQRWIQSGKLKVRYLSEKKLVARPQDVDKAIESVSQDFESRTA